MKVDVGRPDVPWYRRVLTIREDLRNEPAEGYRSKSCIPEFPEKPKKSALRQAPRVWGPFTAFENAGVLHEHVRLRRGRDRRAREGQRTDGLDARQRRMTPGVDGAAIGLRDARG